MLVQEKYCKDSQGGPIGENFHSAVLENGQYFQILTHERRPELSHLERGLE
jgi:hypothetical protein